MYTYHNATSLTVWVGLSAGEDAVNAEQALVVCRPCLAVSECKYQDRFKNSCSCDGLQALSSKPSAFNPQ